MQKEMDAKLHIVFDVIARDGQSRMGAKFMQKQNKTLSNARRYACNKKKATTATTRSCTLIYGMKRAHIKCKKISKKSHETEEEKN